MNLYTLAIASFISVLLCMFLILLLAAITYNMKSAQKYRRHIGNAVNQLRLGKMLALLGIDLEKYLHTTNLVEVHDHITKCSVCENNEICDEELAKNQTSLETVHFCNNKKHLRDLIVKQVAADK